MRRRLLIEDKGIYFDDPIRILGFRSGNPSNSGWITAGKQDNWTQRWWCDSNGNFIQYLGNDSDFTNQGLPVYDGPLHATKIKYIIQQEQRYNTLSDIIKCVLYLSNGTTTTIYPTGSYSGGTIQTKTLSELGYFGLYIVGFQLYWKKTTTNNVWNANVYFDNAK